MDNPLISIVTPTFNRVKYLEACLQSVLSQSYSNIEHIIVDGASTDGTVEMLASYQAKYPDRIRFISEPDNSAEEAVNKGFAMVKGEIVGWLGSDDTYEPDAIEAVVGFFRAKTEAYFVFGDCNFINDEGEIIGKYKTKDFDLDEIINDSCHIPAPSAFYKREVIEKVGGWDTTIKCSDVDYWIRVGKLFPIYRIRKVLSNFRGHQNKRGSAALPRKMYFRESYLMSRRHRGRLFSPRARRYFMCLITDPIRPILLFVYYPFLARVVEWLRPIFGFAYPFAKKTLVKLTIIRPGE